MIATFIFLCAIGAMVLLVAWALKNDDLGPSGKTTGLFAMKEPEDAEPAPEKKPPPYVDPGA